MSDKPTVEPLPPEERDNVLDLDEYRKRRIEAGDWPPTLDEHIKFFSRWKESKKK